MEYVLPGFPNILPIVFFSQTDLGYFDHKKIFYNLAYTSHQVGYYHTLNDEITLLVLIKFFDPFPWTLIWQGQG